MKYVFVCAVLFVVQNSFAQSKLPVAADVLKNGEYAPVVRAGVRDAQIGLHKQNVVDPNSPDPAGLAQMQAEALKKAGNDPIARKQQFNLGAEILPFVAPWINEIAKDCMSKISINLETQKAAEAAAECTKGAVAEFQKNPGAFIEKLSAEDKLKLQALVERRLRESAETRKPTAASP